MLLRTSIEMAAFSIENSTKTAAISIEIRSSSHVSPLSRHVLDSFSRKFRTGSDASADELAFCENRRKNYAGASARTGRDWADGSDVGGGSVKDAE